MATLEVPRMQALVGLSIMSFCTLAFHACSRSLYTISSPPSSIPWPPTQPSTLTPSELSTIMTAIESLSQTISSVNISLHHEFSSLQKLELGVLLMAVWCANLGLIFVVLGTEGRRWYVYVLATVWPMQIVMGVRVLVVGEREVVRVEGRVDEKGKERKDEGEKKS
ncbi:hypothetical protein BDZ45DRAFT_739442 [Acephala macrosclerotiorum]|nr:hypothetical protein BDZ45DRAFT_739442 [Acephala macrosclerotiorum]